MHMIADAVRVAARGALHGLKDTAMPMVIALSNDSAFEKVTPAGAHTSRSGRCPFSTPSRNAVQTPSANPAPACS